MVRFVCLVGQKFARLTVISRTHSKNKKACWECQCECGKTVFARTGDLKSGNTKSCGCLRSDRIKTNSYKHGHGRTNALSPTYQSYTQMLTRCRNPNRNNWQNYGGRGITVCQEWQNSFESFLKDMGERPSLQHSIDRIDVNGNYEPSNCRWANKKDQGRNKRTNHLVEWNGKTQTLIEWAEELKINKTTLSARINTYGWTIEKAFTTRP